MCYGVVYGDIAHEENGWLCRGKFITLLTFELNSSEKTALQFYCDFCTVAADISHWMPKNARRQNRENGHTPTHTHRHTHTHTHTTTTVTLDAHSPRVNYPNVNTAVFLEAVAHSATLLCLLNLETEWLVQLSLGDSCQLALSSIYKHVHVPNTTHEWVLSPKLLVHENHFLENLWLASPRKFGPSKNLALWLM